jgi:DNA polymerase III alpha subunit (gram-positive type)
MTKPIYCVLDFETTGLDPKVDQVTEIGAVLTDLEVVLGTFNAFVALRQGVVLSDFIKNYTGITEYETSSGMNDSSAFQALNQFIYGRPVKPIVVAQFAPFDFSFLAEYGIYPSEFICTRAMSRLLDPTLSASLKDVYPRLTGKAIEKHHTAVGDCYSTLEVFKIQKKRADEAGVDYVNIVNDSADRPLKFIPHNAKVVTI